MVSRKLVHRTNAWLIQVDFFYTYSWVNGLCFGYFQFFLSALRSIKNYVNPSLRYVLSFASCGLAPSSREWPATRDPIPPLTYRSASSVNLQYQCNNIINTKVQMI